MLSAAPCHVAEHLCSRGSIGAHEIGDMDGLVGGEKIGRNYCSMACRFCCPPCRRFFFFCPRKLPLQGAHGNASVQFLRLAPQINFSSLVLFAVLIDCFCLPPFALNEALAVKMCQLRRSRSILVASEPTRALKLRC